MSRDSLYQQTRSHLAYLKLGAAADALPGELDIAMKTKATHTEFLERVLAIEVRAVEARRHAGLLRFANFPAPWRLEDFDFGAQPSVDPALLRDLATCRYATDATNVLFIGPPGVGKTMLAIALGHAAVDAGCGPITQPPLISRPAAARPPSKDAGPPPCGSSTAPPC
jgi:DNA replication protein DnaC